MKVSTSAFSKGQQNIPSAPDVIFRQYEAFMQTFAVPMRNFNIGQITLAIEVGDSYPPILEPGFKPLVDDIRIPTEILLRRKTIIRGLRCIMEAFSIQQLTLEMTPKEEDELLAYWDYLKSGNTEKLDAVQFKDVPLRFDVDPETIKHDDKNNEQGMVQR